MTDSLKLSNRSNISVFRALDILRQVNEREAGGADIKRMGAGQPNVGAPKPALDYAIEMIQKDPKQGYTEAIGMPSLRERIAQYYKDYYGVSVRPHCIIVTTGSSGGFIFDFIAAFDAGDRVAVFTPTYPAYRNILQSLNIECVEIEGHAGNGYKPSVDLLEKYGEKLDGLIINSPSNPCGTMLSDSELEEICAWCERNGVRLISDEAYHGITYGRKSQTALKYSKDAIVLNTFSKYFAMTGWRLGWTIVPENMADRIKKLSESLIVSPPTISQHVAYKVFDHLDILDGYVADYKRNRDILLNELPQAKMPGFTDADGAFYVYVDVSHLSNDSEAFCAKMLDEAGVSATPGVDFDLTRGATGIRICYADSEENIIEACARLKNWQS